MSFDFVLRKYLVQVCLIIWSIVPSWDLDGLQRSEIYRMKRKDLEYTIRWFYSEYLEYEPDEAMKDFRQLLRKVIE